MLKASLKFAASCVIAFYLVVKPLGASLLVSIATKSGLDQLEQIKIIAAADTIDPCNFNFMGYMAEAYEQKKMNLAALIAYGRLMECSTWNANARFKYGQMMLVNQMDGFPFFKEALTLEPNNPIFYKENENLTKLLQQFRLQQSQQQSLEQSAVNKEKASH